MAANDRAKLQSAARRSVIFSHSPLYKYYANWKFWTQERGADPRPCCPLQHVSVIHGHKQSELM